MLGPLPLFLVIPPANVPDSPAPHPRPVSSEQQPAVQGPELSQRPPAIAPNETWVLAPESLSTPGRSAELITPSMPREACAASLAGLQPGENWSQCPGDDFQVYSSVELNTTELLQELAGVDLVSSLAESGLMVPLNGEALPATAKNSPLGNQRPQIEQQLTAISESAETAAPSATSAQQARRIRAAVEFARAGKFENARRVIQHATVSEAVQTQVLTQVSALEADFNRHRVAEQADQIRAANQARQLRQPGLLQGRTSGIAPIQVGPLSVTQRGFGYVGTLPTLSKDYYRKVLQFPGKLGGPALMFPLPIPAPITSGVGWRSHPVLGSQRFHSGTDIGAPEGTPILAIADGKVTGADNLGGYGLAVVIEHNNGTLETLYAHMSEILVRPGEWVPQGTIIGRVGSTGLSTGPHLHFEVKRLTSEGWMLVDAGPQLALAQEQLARVLQGGSLQLQATQLGQAFVGAAGGAQAIERFQPLPEVVVPRVLARAVAGDGASTAANVTKQSKSSTQSSTQSPMTP